jgi:flagellar biosynthetic protein FliR
MESTLLPGLSSDTFTAFLLVLARTSSWVLTAPGFSARGPMTMGRLAISVALALLLTPILDTQDVPQDLASFATLALVQVAIGVALGFLTALLFAAFEVAGTLADLSSGFSFAQVLDPLSGQSAAAFSRFFAMTFTAVLFAMDGHAQIVRGFVRSFTVIPLTDLPTWGEGGVAALASATTQVMAAGIQIAAPLLGVLFLTDVALGLASRFVPQANALAVALPLKTLVALTAAGATMALLPGHVAGLLDPATTLPYEVIR